MSDAVKGAREVDPGVAVLCGAGISNGEDVRVALKLDAKGVCL